MMNTELTLEITKELDLLLANHIVKPGGLVAASQALTMALIAVHAHIWDGDMEQVSCFAHAQLDSTLGKQPDCREYILPLDQEMKKPDTHEQL